MAAPPGSKTYGILSVLLQAWYHVEYLFTVHENAFIPPPKVKSAVVLLTRNQRDRLSCNEKLFKTLVKTGFNQRRKMLRNSLKSLLPDERALPDDPLLTKRPEQLSVAQFEELIQVIVALYFQAGTQILEIIIIADPSEVDPAVEAVHRSAAVLETEQPAVVINLLIIR